MAFSRDDVGDRDGEIDGRSMAQTVVEFRASWPGSDSAEHFEQVVGEGQPPDGGAGFERAAQVVWHVADLKRAAHIVHGRAIRALRRGA